MLSGRSSAHTEPEMLLRPALFSLGLRYRLNRPVAPKTKADIVFSAARLAIFVDGCFWHGCPIHGRRRFSGPNAATWRAKMRRNKEGDEVNTRLAKAAGWKVLRLWECDVRESPTRLARKVRTQVLKRTAPRGGQNESRTNLGSARIDGLTHGTLRPGRGQRPKRSRLWLRNNRTPDKASQATGYKPAGECLRRRNRAIEKPVPPATNPLLAPPP
jgi:DNA mismatch endonuclease, patch repair protein